jgi:hypothetical protein
MVVRLEHFDHSSFSTAAKIESKTLDLLKHTNQLLTISYDGGTTKATESIYTIHITFGESSVSYFVLGDKSSGVSHDAIHISTAQFFVGGNKTVYLATFFLDPSVHAILCL